MAEQKPKIIFASGSSNLLKFLCEPIAEATGLEVEHYYIIDEDEDTAEMLRSEKNTACIVIFTERYLKEDGKQEEIYAYWRRFFPTTPILWCEPEDDNEFFGRDDWHNITWFDTDQPTPYTKLVKLLKKYSM